MNKYIIAIPFYKNEIFIEAISSWFSSVQSLPDRKLIQEILIINDCPGSDQSDYLKKECEKIGFHYLENSKNIGYLKTVNSAYARAKSSNLNLILLNSETIPFSGFVDEIDKCFDNDRMLGIVSPRSNNATICNLYPRPNYYENADSLKKYELDRQIFLRHIPRVSYTPVATGFCFAIRNNIIQLFEGFDEKYTVGYEEENDFCLRVSQRGFRIGIANRAFVVHLEGKSFGLTNYREKIRAENAEILRKNFPYYDNLLSTYGNSITHRLQSKISSAAENSTRYLVDARVLAPYHNGSNKLIIDFLKAISTLNTNVDVCIHKSALDFHELSAISNITFIESPSKEYQYGFMLGQPMSESALWLVPTHSLISICIFFDTIAHDCPQLITENPLIDSVWNVLPFVYTDISFISRHSLEQFKLKFETGTANLHTHLLPIDTSIFIEPSDTLNNKSALIFGNKFLHKGIDLVLNELPEKSGFTYFVLGNPIQTMRKDIIFLTPGHTSEETLDKTMRDVAYILMPSFAEGFGFPILEALNYGKKIYCRDIPCYREIISAIPSEFKPLIKIVRSFSNLEEELESNPEGTVSESYESYKDYLNRILQDLTRLASEDFFNIYKGRYILVQSGQSGKQGYSTIDLLKYIYSLFLKTPFAPYVRRFKSMLFAFKRFIY